MSKLNFLKPTAMIVVGAFIGYFSVKFIQPEPSVQNRFLASATMAKIGSEQYSRNYFDVKIKNESIAQSPNEVSTVKVTVEAFQKLPSGLTFTWHLPEGAEVVDGSLTGFLKALEANETQEIEVKIKGYSKETKNHVVFAIKGDINQSLIDRNVIASSRPEDSFEYVVKANEQAKVEVNKKNKLGKSGQKNQFDPKNVIF